MFGFFWSPNRTHTKYYFNVTCYYNHCILNVNREKIFKSYRDYQIRQYKSQGLDPGTVENKQKIEERVTEQVVRLEGVIYAAKHGQIEAKRWLPGALHAALPGKFKAPSSTPPPTTP